MNALVTGGGGFLGFAVVKLLREHGHTVRSYSRQRHSKLDALSVEQYAGDLTDLSSLTKAIDGCDTVFHVAAKAGVWGPWRDYFATNVTGTRNILTACRTASVPRLVFTSSPSVTFAGEDQEGINEKVPYPATFLAHYPHTKAIAEQEVMAANSPELATVSLRPHLIWGPDDPHLIPRLVERAKAGKLRRIGHASKLVDTTFVDNAAMAHLQTAKKLAPGSPVAGKAYFLSQGQPEPLWDFINRVMRVAALPEVTKTVSPRLALTAGAVLETAYRLTGRTAEPPMTRFVARQLSTSHWFDLTAARRDFGYSPQVSTAKGFELMADWLKSLAG
ncbi:NAD-dependent epimerase/dehydratase family protein [Zavarzinella formosa]|uniref:NAD-dependent epimerase/dehydratase family protein n=1 Tax=Zavarzinella formosa TaxID=360055 RepID=UPI00036BDC00|nr:NAD-dependent epimerase/dehydratase family protein [Zavarzinella formosa]